MTVSRCAVAQRRWPIRLPRECPGPRTGRPRANPRSVISRIATRAAAGLLAWPPIARPSDPRSLEGAPDHRGPAASGRSDDPWWRWAAAARPPSRSFPRHGLSPVRSQSWRTTGPRPHRRPRRAGRRAALLPGDRFPPAQRRRAADTAPIAAIATRASLSESSLTATATSISRVNRGSTRAETAKPPTSAQSRPYRAKSTATCRRAASRTFMRTGGKARQSHRRTARQASILSRPAASPRLLRRSPQGGGAAAQPAASARQTRTCPMRAGTAAQPSRRPHI